MSEIFQHFGIIHHNIITGESIGLKHVKIT